MCPPLVVTEMARVACLVRPLTALPRRKVAPVMATDMEPAAGAAAAAVGYAPYSPGVASVMVRPGGPPAVEGGSAMMPPRMMGEPAAAGRGEQGSARCKPFVHPFQECRQVLLSDHACGVVVHHVGTGESKRRLCHYTGT